MLLNSGPLAVEGVVGRALEALRANARSPAAGGGVAESGQCARGASSGTEAEHRVDCVACRGVEWRVVGGIGCSELLMLEVALRCLRSAPPGVNGVPEGGIDDLWSKRGMARL